MYYARGFAGWRDKILAIGFLAAFVTLFPISHATAIATTTVYYQPTPFPASTTNGIHITDGWLPSFYYGAEFQENDHLIFGGWGDWYYTLVKFDAHGLPSNVSSATLELMPYDAGAGYNLVDAYVYLITQDWNPATTTWSNQPTASYLGMESGPSYGTWWNTDITDQYNDWLSGAASNYGISFEPTINSNDSFDTFRPSRYTDDDGDRPVLELQFVPPVDVPDFKMPLPGDAKWLVTMEPGGYACTGAYDPYHDDDADGNNYFSIDFGWNAESATSSDFIYSSDTDNIPILAAATGTVVQVGDSAGNGNFVVISNDPGGDVDTGFSTRYLHMKDGSIVVAVSDVVNTGDLLGYMGDTGAAQGVHLHFGMRYDDSGASTTDVQYATVDDLLVKSYQTECDTASPWAPIRRYPSSNTSYLDF